MHDLEDSPPRRPASLLQSWLSDFADQGHAIAGSISVAAQEDVDEQDTGLVIMTLAHAGASVFFQAVGYNKVEWEATLTGIDEETTLSPHALASLAAELVIAGNLCTYLQWRALEWDRNSGQH